LNLITPAKRKQAAALVKESVSVSMAGDLDTEKAVDNPNPFELQMLTIGSDQISARYHGMTPLLYAASVDFGSTEMIETLLKAHPNISARTNGGVTARINEEIWIRRFSEGTRASGCDRITMRPVQFGTSNSSLSRPDACFSIGYTPEPNAMS
jgi:hypothetical protein